MDLERALVAICGLLKDAGKLAREAQGTAGRHMKADDSVVTETDLAISRMAHAQLAPWLSQPGHVLLDEESIDGVGTPEEVFATTTWQWVLDPIDGTAGYALGRSRYGISLGLLENGVPRIGAIYLPAEHRLFVATETETYRVERAFTPDETRVPLVCRPFEMNNQIFVETYAHLDEGRPFGYGGIWASTPDSAVEGFTNALAGWAAGATAMPMYSIWDVAAAFAMARHAGFAVRAMDGGAPFERFSAANIKPNWKVGTPWLLCADANFDYICGAIKGE